MADLAVLGLQIESDGAVKAANDLDKLSASATKAEKATDSAGKASEQASMRMAAGSKAVERLLAAIEKVERAVRDQNAALGNMGGAMARVEAQMEAASKAAQSVASSVSGAGAAATKAAAQVATLGTSGASAAAGIAATAAGAATMGAGLVAANQNVKLTSNQLLNLSRQANDAFTMLASGSDITQVFATQIGQVYGALEEGPQGLRGSLKALGSAIIGLITPTTLAIAGLAAAAAAARYFGNDTAANMEKAEKAAKSYEKSIQSLKTAQGDLGGVMGRIFDREMIQSVDEARRQLQLLAQEQMRAKKALGDVLVDAGTPGMLETLNPLGPMRELFRMGEGSTNKGTFGVLGAEWEAGRRSAQSLREEVEKILLDDSLPEDLRELGTRMLESAKQAAEVEARIKAITTAIREQKREIANENYKKATDAFDQFLPNTRTQRERVEQAYRERVAAIKALQDNPRAMEGRLNTAEAQRLAALKEIDRQEEVMRQGRELDIKAIGAQTVAERALLAAQRERLALSEPGANRDEIERKATAASLMVYAQAEREAAEAARAARISREQAGLEGYAAQVAAVNAQFAEQIRLAEGSEAAVRDLTAARDAELEALEVSTRRSLFSSQEDSIRQLQAEAGMIGMNDDARRVALATLQAEADLRRQGIDLNGAWGKSYVDNARHIATLENALDKQQEAFEDLRDAAGDFFSSLSSGKGILESFVSAFAQFGNKLASQGFEKLFGGLFGAGAKGGSNAVQIASTIGQAVSAAPRYSAVEQTYAAPLGRVDRAPLGPVTVSLPTSASSTVARAGNAFLDLIRRAEGTAGANGYNTSLAYGRFTGGERNLTGMTLNQIDALQTSMLAHPGNTYNSSALGAYQIVRTTLRDLRKQLGLDGGQLFSPELQDRLALTLAQRRGASATGLRNEWEGFHKVGSDEILGAYRSGVMGQNVASSTNDTKVIAKGVSTGVVDANRQMSGGGDPWAGLRTATGPVPTAGMAGGGGLFSGQGMGLIGAGVGSFASGYQSGSPISGALGGAMAGFAAGGPIGALVGALAGGAGGIFGGRAQRKEAHKQAAAQWEEIRPQYEAFDQSLSGEGKGGIREWLTSTWAQLSGFMSVGGKAWKMGTGNSTAQFKSTGDKMFARFQEMRDEFVSGFNDMVEDLSSGEGLAGAFAKGRAATKDLQKQIDGMLDDVSIAFGSADIGIPIDAAALTAEKEWEERRNAAMERAKLAAGEYSLSLLYTAETTSEIAKSLDGFRGTAAGLHKVLIDLGWTAEKAAADIDDRLSQAIAKIGETFVDGFQRQINDLSGVGYLNDIDDLVKSRDASLSDAKLLGVDPSIVTKWFDLALADIVTSSEVTGDALEELKRKFPDLSEALANASKTVGMTAAEITEALQRASVSRYERAIQERAEAEAALRTEYERTVDRIKGITDFLSDMRLDDNTSILNGQEQFEETQRLYRETLFKANGGDQDAQDKLLGVSQDYLDEAKAYYATSEKYGEVYREIESTLKASATRMETELDVARRQASFLEEIAGGTKGLSALLEKYLEADRAVGGSLSDLDANRQWGVRPVANRKNVAEFRAAGLPEYTGNFGPDTWPQIEAWLNTLSLSQRAQAMAIMTANNAIGYASGGYTGMGGVNEVAGMVHRGEVVWSQDDVRAWGGPQRVDAMRVARMPEMPMMQPSAGNNDALIAEVRGLREEVRSLRAVSAQGSMEVRGAVERGNDLQRQNVSEQKRRNAA